VNKSDIEACKRFFDNTPDFFDVKEILRYYLALNQKYQINNNHMPLPIWRRKGFTDDEKTAWERLQYINDQIPPDRGISIYVHVPFCPSRCSFCDCLTMQVRNHIPRVLNDYHKALLHEINAWQACSTLPKRPVTTVHFGGGTPLFLGFERFQSLVDALRASFNVTAETEWAIETTSASLNPPMLEKLTELGIRRLHLGVQSMEDHVRPLLKRRESSSQVLEKIRKAHGLGWITSVDLLVGLPLETPSGMLVGINDLIDAGVDGFSIYEINLSNQNMRFANQYHLLDRDRRENYFLFLAAVNHLNQAGFRKNLFNHFANDRDQNLYFTFPLRSEDCLAIGAYADGVFDDYHYRHLNYRKTMDQTTPTQPALQGGIKQPEEFQKLFPVEILLLSGEFTSKQINQVLPHQKTDALIQPWEAALLVEKTQPGCYSLTPNGAWFSGNMITDLESVTHHRV